MKQCKGCKQDKPDTMFTERITVAKTFHYRYCQDCREEFGRYVDKPSLRLQELHRQLERDSWSWYE